MLALYTILPSWRKKSVLSFVWTKTIAMIKLFSLKQQKKDGVDAGGQSGSHKKSSAAQLRIQKGSIRLK